MQNFPILLQGLLCIQKSEQKTLVLKSLSSLATSSVNTSIISIPELKQKYFSSSKFGKILRIDSNDFIGTNNVDSPAFIAEIG